MKTGKIIQVLSGTDNVNLINIKLGGDEFKPRIQEIIDYANVKGIEVSFFDTIEESLDQLKDVVSFAYQLVHITVNEQLVEILSMSFLAAKDAAQEGNILSFLMDAKNVKCSRFS